MDIDIEYGGKGKLLLKVVISRTADTVMVAGFSSAI